MRSATTSVSTKNSASGAPHRPAAASAEPTDKGTRPQRGLADVVVADTRISEVDGQAGELIVAGEALADFSRRGFASGCGQLWQQPAERVQSALGEARLQAHAQRARWQAALRQPDPLVAMRAALTLMVHEGGDALEQHAHIAGAIAVSLAAWLRQRRDGAVVAPDANAGHAQDFMRLALGDEDAERARALDRYLCTVIDHGLNASTFAARVVASTGADLLSAVVAAISALSGPLHGGAPGPVLDMLDAIGEADQARPWLRAELAAGRRIMGMGHRVYRVRDPRAAALQEALEQLDPDSARLQLARVVEREAEALLQQRYPARSLRANVEMYTALLLDGLGFARSSFTAIFAMARCAGWCAHYREQRAEGTLIRPRSRYIGPRPTAAPAPASSGG